MRGGQQTQPRGLQKANRQLLLASELTLEDEVAEQLAELAHRVGELATAGEIEAASVEEIGAQLQTLRDETHTDVRDAIVRAQELLLPYSESTTTA
jgi:c-di-GMP-related signal transduction protein